MLVAIVIILQEENNTGITQEENNPHPKKNQLERVRAVAGLVDEDKIRIWLEGGNGKENDCKFNCVAAVKQ